MFLQVCVCPQGGGGVCLSACWDTTSPQEQTPPEQTPPKQTHPQSRHPQSRHPPSRHTPRADTPQSRHPPGADPQEQTPPKSRHPPEADTLPRADIAPRADTQQRADTPPQDTATAADGMHPTRMHSCLGCHSFGTTANIDFSLNFWHQRIQPAVPDTDIEKSAHCSSYRYWCFDSLITTIQLILIYFSRMP